MKELFILLLAIYGASAGSKIHLIPSHIICPEVTKDHDILMPDPSDCTVFYKCENGSPVPQSCPDGLEWCQQLSKCTIPIIANCSIGQHVVTYSPEEIKDHSVICPENGVTIPDPMDCTSYFICSNYTQKTQHCPSDYEYSCWIGECISAEVSNCIIGNIQEGKPCPKNGKRLQNPEDCGSYYECIEGKARLRHCKHGEEYNTWHEVCVLADYAQCKEYKTNITSTTPIITPKPEPNICPMDGIVLPDLLDCNKYYVCKNNTPTGETCPDNLAYSCWDKECINPVEALCFDVSITVDVNCTIEGLQLYDPYDCSSYYVCVNGKTEKRQCANNLQYNNWYGKCVTSNVSYCTSANPTPTTVSSTIHPGITPNPNSNVCPIDGILLPDHENCNMYYECINDAPVRKTCPNNLAYSCWDQRCVPADTANCIQDNQTGQQCNNEGLKLPNVYDCDHYYECRNNSVTENHCGEGQQYNEWFSNCYDPELAHCSPITETTTLAEISTTNTSGTVSGTATSSGVTISPDVNSCPVEGSVLADVTDCFGFYICTNGRPFHYDCPAPLRFNAWECQCQNSSAHICVNDTEIGKPCKKNGYSLPILNDCKCYYECVDGSITKSCCPDSSEYNVWFKKCVSKQLSHCPFKQTSNSTPTPSPITDVCPKSGGLLPNPSNCSTYYECKDGTPVLQHCNTGLQYSCWEQKCAPSKEANCLSVGSQTGKKCSHEGQRIQNPDSCNSYYECSKGKVITKSCPWPLQYNKWFGICLLRILSHCQTSPDTTTKPTTIPISSSADICPVNGDTLPNINDCEKYYSCENTTAVVKNCAKGEKYSAWDSACLPETEANCFTVNNLGKNCSINGVRLPNIENCNSFYECVNGKVEKKHCFLFSKYNKWYKKCVSPSYAHCDVSTPPPTTTTTETPPTNVVCRKEGTIVANPTDCSSYFECEKGKPHLKRCPNGTEFDCWDEICKTSGTARCITDQSAHEGNSCSHKGQKIPNVKNCNRYYECNGKTIENKRCSLLKQFSTWNGKCVLLGFAHCANNKFLGII